MSVTLAKRSRDEGDFDETDEPIRKKARLETEAEASDAGDKQSHDTMLVGPPTTEFVYPTEGKTYTQTISGNGPVWIEDLEVGNLSVKGGGGGSATVTADAIVPYTPNGPVTIQSPMAWVRDIRSTSFSIPLILDMPAVPIGSPNGANATIYTLIMPAGLLKPQDKLVIETRGVVVQNANAKTIQHQLDDVTNGTTITAIGQLNMQTNRAGQFVLTTHITAGNNGQACHTYIGIHTGPTADTTAQFYAGGNSTATMGGTTFLWNNVLSLKLQTTTGAVNDIIVNSCIMTLYKQDNNV